MKEDEEEIEKDWKCRDEGVRLCGEKIGLGIESG